MIKPTVGRVVWFWIHGAPQLESKQQPYAAIITYVHSDTMVNIATFDHTGQAHYATSIALYQGEGERPKYQHCEWMPYQKEKALMDDAKAAMLAR